MYLYLDESGDQGADFESKKPSRHFVMTVLAVSSRLPMISISNVVKKTLGKKINQKSKKSRIVSELKGSGTSLEIRKYFFINVAQNASGWFLYSVILDKHSLIKNELYQNKNKIYNQMALQLIEKVDFGEAKYINLIVDRSKDALGISDFDSHIATNLHLNPGTRLYIEHGNSEKYKCIQATDLFSYDIFRKYEAEDERCYDLFKHKLRFEGEFKTRIKKDGPCYV